MGPDVIQVPESRCLECGTSLNAIGSPDGSEPQPKPGDPVVCIRCGAVMTVNPAGALCGFTDAQMDELMADREHMDQLAAMVSRVHLIHAAVN